MENRPKKLLEQVSDQIRLKHYSYRTVRVASLLGERNLHPVDQALHIVSK